MGKPFDVSKFRKEITKSIDGLSIGFNDPTDWISTGNFALNYLISGDFNKGIPLGKVTVFAGESGAGKSYFCSGNIVKDAQAQGIYVVLIDSENALDESWLHALGVDTSEEKLLKLNMAMIDDVAKTISTFMKDYKAMDEADLIESDKCNNVFIESHTVSHPILTQCSDDEADKEIHLSKVQLEKMLGRKIKGLAYPNGAYTQREIMLLEKHGYDYAFTTRSAYLTPKDLKNRFELPRFEVLDYVSFAENKCRIAGVWFKKNRPQL
jgi:hypothetical protein